MNEYQKEIEIPIARAIPIRVIKKPSRAKGYLRFGLKMVSCLFLAVVLIVSQTQIFSAFEAHVINVRARIVASPDGKTSLCLCKRVLAVCLRPDGSYSIFGDIFIKNTGENPANVIEVTDAVWYKLKGSDPWQMASSSIETNIPSIIPVNGGRYQRFFYSGTFELPAGVPRYCLATRNELRVTISNHPEGEHTFVTRRSFGLSGCCEGCRIRRDMRSYLTDTHDLSSFFSDLIAGNALSQRYQDYLKDQLSDFADLDTAVSGCGLQSADDDFEDYSFPRLPLSDEGYRGELVQEEEVEEEITDQGLINNICSKFFVESEETVIEDAVEENIIEDILEVETSEEEEIEPEDNFVELTPEERLIPLTPEEGGPPIEETVVEIEQETETELEEQLETASSTLEMASSTEEIVEEMIEATSTEEVIIRATTTEEIIINELKTQADETPEDIEEIEEPEPVKEPESVDEPELTEPEESEDDLDEETEPEEGTIKEEAIIPEDNPPDDSSAGDDSLED